MTAYRSGNLRGIQGAGNEQLVAARALKHGFIAFFKLWSDTKYDMVIDCEGELFRVQIKGSQTRTLSFVGGARGGIQVPTQRIRTYTRDDCDTLIGVDANNGDCYVVPIDYITALGKTSASFRSLHPFYERWDYIGGNGYLSVTQSRQGIVMAELQNKLRSILPGVRLPPDLNGLRKLFYERCPPPP